MNDNYRVIRTFKHGTGRIDFTIQFPTDRGLMIDGHITATTRTFVIDKISDCEPDELLLAASFLMARLQQIRDAIHTDANAK